MKYTLPTLALASFTLLSSCGDKDPHHAGDDHDHGAHAAHAHGADADDGHKHDDHSSCDHGPAGHEDHAGHEHAKAGPNHGRMIENVTPQAEFLVRDDRTVQITFYDADMQQVAPTNQVVSVHSGDRSDPIELTFSNRKGVALVSEEALPEGNNFPTIVSIKASADAEEIVTKLTLNLSDCPTCSNKEYACECHH